MEKVKSAFSKCGASIKAHWKVVVAVVAVLLVIILIANIAGGSEKRAIQKHLKALNACDDAKVIKTMDLEAAIAWANSSGSEDRVEAFQDELDDVEKDAVKDYEDQIEKSIDKDDKGEAKVKLLKIVYSTKAKDDKNLKKVVAKVRLTVKPDKDDDDDDEESIWKNEKKYTSVTEGYVTFYLYKNKVIYSPYVTSPSYSSYNDYSDYADYLY